MAATLSLIEQNLNRKEGSTLIPSTDALPQFPRIPAEIRIKIFKLLLQNSGFISILFLKDDQNLTLKSFAADNLVVTPFARDGPYDIHPAILRCCRLFHTEGRPILYPEDCVVIERMKCFPRWGPDLSGHYIRRLNHPLPIVDLWHPDPKEIKTPFSYQSWQLVREIRGISVSGAADVLPYTTPWPSLDCLLLLLSNFPNLRKVVLEAVFDMDAYDLFSWEEVQEAFEGFMDSAERGVLREITGRDHPGNDSWDREQELICRKKGTFHHEVTVSMVWKFLV